MSDVAPLISVLLPVYNAEAYLAEAIRSILHQTFTDFELLILDDGSSDRSADIARTFQQMDERVRLRSRSNAGLTATLNELIEWPRGEYLARMDADDISLPDRFAKQVEFLASHSEVAVVGSAHITMDEVGRKVGVVRHPLDQPDIEAALFAGHAPIAHPAAMMRAKVIRQLGGYLSDYDGAEDYDLWLRLVEHSQLANLPDVLLLYRVHPKSISGSNAIRQISVARLALSDAKQRRGNFSEMPPMVNWRPADDVDSRRAFAIQTGWTAWSNGFRSTWRYYAIRCVRASPFSLDAWRLLIFGFVRRPAKSSYKTS